MKPNLGLNQDHQCKIKYKTNWKADLMAKKGKFNAKYFMTSLPQGLSKYG